MRGLLARGEVSAAELVAAHMARIAERNPALNAIVTLVPERALAEAAAADAMAAGARLTGEPLPPLHGLPVVIKDTHLTAGVGQADRVPLIRPGDHRQQQGDVRDAPPDRALGAQRRERQASGNGRHPARGGPQPHHCAERGRIPQRPAHVTAVGQRRQARRDRRRGPAAAAPGAAGQVIRVDRDAEDLVERV